MLGHRMSSLPLASVCPKAPLLSASQGSSILALKGQAAHARFAGDQERYRHLTAGLPQKDRDEVDGWHRPADVQFLDGEHSERVNLVYDKADKELEVALDTDGLYVPASSPRAFSVGHLDMAWVHTFSDGMRVAYIGDAKKCAWTTVDGPDTLQCAAYGFAYASKMGCQGFVCGLWIYEADGGWLWSSRYHDLESTESMALLDRVLRAAGNLGNEAVTGTHCWNCYGRLHCSEWLLPATSAKELGVIQGLSEELPGGVSEADAVRLIRWCKSVDDLKKLVLEHLKTQASRNGGFLSEDGTQRWRVRYNPGRESCSVKDVRAKFGDMAEDIIHKGGKYPVSGWVKVRK